MFYNEWQNGNTTFFHVKTCGQENLNRNENGKHEKQIAKQGNDRSPESKKKMHLCNIKVAGKNMGAFGSQGKITPDFNSLI